jgi:hypothetical protein
MSHFTRVRTQLVDEGCLRASLSDAGYVVPAGRTRIGGWLGSDEEVDVGVPDVVDGYGIGFTWEQSGSYAAVADWSELKHRGIRKGEFVGRVSHLYGVQATLRTMEPQGFVVAERTSQADGSVRIVMRRVA